jgi:hypothetical protein
MMYATLFILAQAWASGPRPPDPSSIPAGQGLCGSPSQAEGSEPLVRPGPTRGTAGSAHPGPARACSPLLAALFTPQRPEIGRYEVSTASDALERVMAAGRSEGLHYGDIDALEALDAFGTAGPYDRFTVARLYGGARARVVHGWRDAASGFESVTLISPYPDGSLSRLMPGTMAIRLTISR